MGREWIATAVVLMLSVTALSAIVADTSDGSGDNDGLLIYEIYPRTKHEGVSLFNYGTSAVDLRDYSLAEKSGGKITFLEELMVQPGERITLCKEKSDTDKFASRDNVHAYGTKGIEADSKFQLNDKGDIVFLLAGSRTIDAVCYGEETISDPDLWAGPSVSIGTKHFTQRVGFLDTDSAGDWLDFIPGKTYLPFDPDQKFDAKVTPFVFPESGGVPIYRALENATSTVDIEIYLITNKNLYGLLCDLEARGVEVRLLMEGRPVGNEIANCLDSLKTLESAGAEVRLIGVSDSNDDRFDVVHAKYAIIDKKTVVVTSENWTTDNLNGKATADPYKGSNGNRGWGAIVESTAYADYMQQVFDKDYSMDYDDVKVFSEKYPGAMDITLTYNSPTDTTEYRSYTAQVTPVLSGDSSRTSIRYYMENAENRIYAQNQSLSGYKNDPSEAFPLDVMKVRSASGIDTKVMFGTNMNDPDYVISTINASTTIQAAKFEKPLLHNKGIITDDTAIVNSINWTPTSLDKNRECGVAIHSADVAAFYASIFAKDFDRYYTYDGIRVDLSEIAERYVSGGEVIFSVSVHPASDNYEFEWDFGDGSANQTTTKPRIVAVPSEGTHTLTVTVTDKTTNRTSTVSSQYVISSEGNDEDPLPSGQWIYLAPIVAIIAAVAAVARRGR